MKLRKARKLAKKGQTPLCYFALLIDRALANNQTKRVADLIENVIAAFPYSSYAWLLRAETLADLKMIPEAESSYHKAIELDSGNVMARNSLGLFYVNNNQFEQALPHYDAALRLNPLFFWPHYNRGCLLLTLAKYEEAILAMDECLALKSNFLDAMIIKAISLSELNRLSEAENLLQATVNLDPTRINALAALATFYAKTDENEKRIAVMERWCQLARNDEIVLSSLVELLCLNNNVPKAMHYASLFLKRNPKNASVLFAKGCLHIALDDKQAGQAAIDQALSLNSNLDLGWIVKARLALEQGDPSTVPSLIERAMQSVSGEFCNADVKAALLLSLGKEEEALRVLRQSTNNDANFWLNAGNHFTNLGYKRSAEYCVNRCLEIAPLNVEALLLLGELAYRDKRLTEAIAAYEQVVAIDPSEAFAWGELSVFYAETNALTKAFTAINKALELIPNDVDFLVHQGELFMAIDNWKQANLVLGKAFGLDPTQANVSYKSGLAAVCCCDWTTALLRLQVAVKSGSNNANVWDCLGITLSKLGRDEEALSCFRKAVSLDRQHKYAWFHKAIALANLGRHLEGIDILEHAIHLRPTEPRFWLVLSRLQCAAGLLPEAGKSLFNWAFYGCHNVLQSVRQLIPI